MYHICTRSGSSMIDDPGYDLSCFVYILGFRCVKPIAGLKMNSHAWLFNSESWSLLIETKYRGRHCVWIF